MKEHMWIDNIHRQEQRKYIFHIAQNTLKNRKKNVNSFYSFHKGKLRFFHGNFIMFKVVIFFLENFFYCLFVRGHNRWWVDRIRDFFLLFVVWLGFFIGSEFGDVRKLNGRLLKVIRSTGGNSREDLRFHIHNLYWNVRIFIQNKYLDCIGPNLILIVNHGRFIHRIRTHDVQKT